MASAKVITLGRTYFGMGDSHTPIKAEFVWEKQFFDNLPLHMAYHQKTLWDVNSGSSPVLDTNYNPMLYYALGDFMGWETTLGILEHLSNGQTGDRSRGINMSFINFFRTLKFGSQAFELGLKFYVSYKKDNGSPDIVDYEGIWKGSLNILNPLRFMTSLENNLELRVAPGGTWGQKFENGNFEASFKIFPSSKARFSIYSQFFTGRNEYLLDYKVYHRAIRLGIAFE